MYEHMTFEYILKRMLDRVPNTVDKREGSIIYDALAPAAAELSQMYIELDVGYNLCFADTATGEYLSRRTAEIGVNRKGATKAIRKGLFFDSKNQPFDISIGSRYSIGDLNYVAIKKLNTGQFEMQCEIEGVEGNQQIGELIPIQFIDGLSRAELTEILIPGEDKEDDESLRKRYFDNLNGQAFGGNIADYIEKVNKLSGVGGVKVFPAWNGGGTVKVVIIDSEFSKPSSTLIKDVQTILDPVQNQGEGLGLAPIGHIVTVEGVKESMINIETNIAFQEGYIWNDIQSNIEKVINTYFEDLRKTWDENNQLVVRISQIETRILNVTGVLDIQNTKINNSGQNLILNNIEIPTLGEVIAI